MEELDYQEWYTALIEECQAIIIEGQFNARWTLIEAYHTLGKRILKERRNFKKRKIYGEEIVQRVARSLGKSTRTIDYAVQFALKFPDLSLAKLGKDWSWHRICNELLPTPRPAVPKLSEGVEMYNGYDKYLEFQAGQSGDFYTALFRAIQLADEINLLRLSRGFPQEVDAYITWSQFGQDAFLAKCSPDHPLVKRVQEGTFIL